MRKTIFVAVVVALAVMLCAGTAMAATSDYWPGGTKPDVTVNEANEMTVAWPAVTGPLDRYVLSVTVIRGETTYYDNVWNLAPGVLSQFVGAVPPGYTYLVQVNADYEGFVDTIKAHYRVR